MSCQRASPGWKRAAGAIALLLCHAVGGTAAAATGEALPGLEPFDQEMAALLERWHVPGANLAVAMEGRIVLARGYGFADRERKVPAEPTTLFRLGSLSKPLTAVAILQLVEEGRLGLDDKVLPILGETGPRPGAITDERVHAITIRHLLRHRAGFDREKSGDAIVMPYAVRAAARQGGTMPPSCIAILRDGLERTLDFAPGSKYAYSNLGYCILGRVIERVSGRPYEAFVRERILAPAGAAGLRLGETLRAASGEAIYYDYPGAPLVEPMPGLGLPGLVARPYGYLPLETMDAYGAWIGSSLDFLRFMLAVDGQRGTRLLKEASVRAMLAMPSGSDPQASFQGLGFRVKSVSGGTNWWHGGSQAGMEALALRTATGYAWVVAFNSRPQDTGRFVREFDQALWRAAKSVKTWPSGDLFPVKP